MATRFLVFFFATLFVAATLLADPMVVINQKGRDVRSSLSGIVSAASLNHGTSPDPALERAISRFEAALDTLDYALTTDPRLPACEKVPVIDTQAAEEALAALIGRQPGQQTDPRIKELIKKKLFLQRVQSTSRNILRVKMNAMLVTLGLNLIPLPGKNAWDFVNLMDNILTRLNVNPTDPNTKPGGMRFKGVDDYRTFIKERGDAFNQFASEQARKNGYVDNKGNIDTSRISEFDVAVWGNAFTLKKSQDELAQLDQDFPQLQGTVQQEQDDAKSRRQYFEGLLGRFQTASQKFAWISNPSSLEKMEGDLKVAVFEDAAGSPLFDPTVDLSPPVTGQQEGRNAVLFPGIGMGKYTIKASKPGYVAESSTVDIADCKTATVSIRLKKKPVIKVADIKDAQGHLIDDVKVNVVDIAGGGTAGSGTYNRVALLFMVNPGAFTVTATDNGNLYEGDSQSVNAEAGTETLVHLVMKEKFGPELVVEVYDSKSRGRIDPPPGSTEPGVRLEPQEGQPAPTAKAYTGNGELSFTQVHSGSYKYQASLCGWESSNGTITVSTDDMKLHKIVRQIYLKPRTLSSFTGNVVELGTDEHLSDFKVALIGLGPRKGYRYDTVEGKFPDPTVVGFHFGAFNIPGPIDSGHYELRIDAACYQPIRSDLWWNFCLEDRSYTPQILQMKPTPEFDVARNQTRAFLKKMKEDQAAAAKAADDMAAARRKAQDLSDLAGNLVKDLQPLKQQYSTLEQDCKNAALLMKDIQDKLAQLGDAETQITILRETARNLAGTACELSDHAQKEQDATKASNLAVNSRKFADKTGSKAEEAKAVAEKAKNDLALLVKNANDVNQLKQNSKAFVKAFQQFAARLQDLRARLKTFSGASSGQASATAALTDAQQQLAAINKVLLPCNKTNSAKSLIAQAITVSKGVADEKKRADDEATLLKELLATTGPLAMQADKLGAELEEIKSYCEAINKFEDPSLDAKASADTIDVFAKAAKASEKEAQDCAQKVGTPGAGNQAITSIEQQMQNCDYQNALNGALQLQAADPQNPWLVQNLARLQASAKALAALESDIQKIFVEAETAMNECDPDTAKDDYDEIVSDFQSKLNNTKCSIYATVKKAADRSKKAEQLQTLETALDPLLADVEARLGDCPDDMDAAKRNIASAEQQIQQLKKLFPACDVSQDLSSMREAKSELANCQDGSDQPPDVSVEELPEDLSTPGKSKEGRPSAGGSVTTGPSGETTPKPPPPPPPAVGQRWVLDSVTVVPTTPQEGYSYGGAQATSIHLDVYEGSKADFQWTPPPAQIDDNGFTMTISAQSYPAPYHGLSVLIGVRGTGLTSDPEDTALYANGKDGQSASTQKVITFKPYPNTYEVEVLVGIMWGVANFTYKYRKAQ